MLVLNVEVYLFKVYDNYVVRIMNILTITVVYNIYNILMKALMMQHFIYLQEKVVYLRRSHPFAGEVGDKKCSVQ